MLFMIYDVFKYMGDVKRDNERDGENIVGDFRV